jgi:hypothetical protein
VRLLRHTSFGLAITITQMADELGQDLFHIANLQGSAVTSPATTVAG